MRLFHSPHSSFFPSCIILCHPHIPFLFAVNEPNTVVDFLLFVCQRVFRLPSWLQRLVHGFDLMLRNTLESFLLWFLAWKLQQIFEGEQRDAPPLTNSALL